jgi:signal transduction histidine kinase
MGVAEQEGGLRMHQIPEYLNLLVGAFDLFVAILVVAELRRLRMGTPRLALLLAAFFAAEFVNRMDDPDPLLGHSALLDVSTDVLIVGILVPLILGARRIARGILASMSEARYRAADYERAKREYTQLVRHRIMNPLAVIRGAALTLEAGTVQDEQVREQLARAIVEASHRLEHISLEPERHGPEESELTPAPVKRALRHAASSS